MVQAQRPKVFGDGEKVTVTPHLQVQCATLDFGQPIQVLLGILLQGGSQTTSYAEKGGSGSGTTVRKMATNLQVFCIEPIILVYVPKQESQDRLRLLAHPANCK